MASDAQEFCLRWNNFRPSVLDSFESLFYDEEFVDVTISAEGQSVKAHKVFLSACSPYFRDLFKEIPMNHHPIIVLKDTRFAELSSLINFMYHGEVHVRQDSLSLLLATAKALKIKGLSDPDFYKALDRDEVLNSPARDEMPEPPPRPPPSEVPAFPYNLPNNTNSYLPGPLLEHYSAKRTKATMARKNKVPRQQSPMERHPTPVQTPPRHPSPLPSHESPMNSRIATPPSANSSHSEEDRKVVNLPVNNGFHALDEKSPPLVIAKLEMEDGTSSLGHTEDDDDNKMDDNEKRIEMPPLSHLALAPYRYPIPPREGFAGPSGVLPPTNNELEWGHPSHQASVPEGCEAPQGSHPVFNELFGGGGGGGGEVGSVVVGGGGGGGGGITGKKAVPTPCPVCQKVLSNAYNMRVHLETHQDITYKCIICGIITRTRDTMRKHCSNVHKLRNLDLKNSFKKITGKSDTKTPPLTPLKNQTPKSMASFSPFSLGNLLTTKSEPLPTMVPFTNAPALNLAKSNLDSIVNKLIQKQ